MWFSSDMFHHMLKAEFVTVVGLKVPSGTSIDPPTVTPRSPPPSLTGVIVTCQGGGGGDGDGKGCDFRSRYFAPWVGIPEDPATGSAHTVLAPYWSDRSSAAGRRRTSFEAWQCSPRGGRLRLELDRENGCLRAAGGAAVVMEGKLYL